MRGRWEVLLAIPGIALACSSGARAQSCEPAAASVISVQGDVEVSGHDRAHWRDVQLNQVLCGGQQLRLMAKSRAVLQLPNETLLHLDERSVLTLQAVAPEKPAWIEFLRGAVHIISRVPRVLNIRTPFVNAGIEGTEFALRVDPAQAELWVYEGRVRFSNTLGQLLIASGEAAAAAPGRPPERRIVVKPRQAVEWALYYPPLLDSRPEPYPETLRPAVLAYRRNDLAAAFAALDGVPEGARDARYHTLLAGLLLSVGRVPEAEGHLTSAERLDPKNGTAYALRSVIAVVRNEQEEALKLAAESVRLAPGSATPYVARSYAEQSAFEIEKAQQSIQQASRLAPEDALVWARLAELELSRGDLDAALEAATKAETLDPGLARTQTVLGFAYLTRIEVDKAKSAFDRALVLDPADPLPRLGMGLAKIRDGDVDEGTKEIEIAASLDPNNSLIRSYLGKAYFEQRRGGLAETEYEQAKLLDPKDPTPWFYDAIHKQTTNRPVEALHDLQKAIDLNDNRAVYRSRLLLDQDLAARSAALGRIYRDLGFEQLALFEGWKSVNTDPGDYSGHRLLADSYSVLPQHGIARVSELLQSQLRQPISLTPVQPHLAERDLLILEGAGPSSVAFNEYNTLFARNRLAFQASGVVGSNNSYGDEITQSGVWNQFSYSFGQFHYETDGFRQNNDLTEDIYNGFVQTELSPDLSLQVEARRRRLNHGDLRFNFELDQPLSDFKRNIDTDSVRFGGHYEPTPNLDFIASITYLTNKSEQDFGGSPVKDEHRGYLIEVQSLLRAHRLNIISGGSVYGISGDSEIGQETPALSEPDILHGNAYLYSYINFPTPATWILGLSFDALDNDLPSVEGNAHNREFDQINPKLGLMWDLTRNTTMRAAAFRQLKRTILFDQTVEPTQIAGFNQFFDDPTGTESRRYGAGVDHKFSSKLYGGIEVSRRDLIVPRGRFDTEDWEEELYRGYLNWTPHPQVAVSLGYQLEDFEDESTLKTPSTRTHLAPAEFRYFHPSGLFGSLRVTYGSQQIAREIIVFNDATGEQTSEIDRPDDEFALVDVVVGFRLPKRYGILTLGVKNVFDEEFNFQGVGGSRTPRQEDGPLFVPEQTAFARLTLAF